MVKFQKNSLYTNKNNDLVLQTELWRLFIFTVYKPFERI